MNALKRFWLWAFLLFLIVVALLASTIWQTAPVKPKSIAATSEVLEEEKSLQSSDGSSQRTINVEFDSSFPAPAKKLHKVISDAGSEIDEKNTLQEQAKKLDEQLAALNQQLQEKGVSAPARPVDSTTNSSSESDTAKRLEAIKKHIEDKKTQ